MSGRIVVGVDGSEHANQALSYALEEARRRQAVLEVVLAYEPIMYYPGLELGALLTPTWDTLEFVGRRVLCRALEHVPADVVVRPVVLEGEPHRALLEAAEDADLLVVGSRGRGGFKGLLLGSTSHRIIGRAPCPVVVVPTAGAEADSRTAA